MFYSRPLYLRRDHQFGTVFARFFSLFLCFVKVEHFNVFLFMLRFKLTFLYTNVKFLFLPTLLFKKRLQSSIHLFFFFEGRLTLIAVYSIGLLIAHFCFKVQVIS